MALVSSSRASQVFSESIQTDYSSLEHENYTNFVSVLKLPFKEKTIENFQRVLLFANSLDFFKNLNEKHGEDATFMCCRYMYFSEYKPQMNICNLNEPCKSIFVLLNGTVNEISEIQINELKKGHKFGDSDCLKPISYQSKTKCSVGAIDISDYKWILDKVANDKINLILDALHKLPLLQGLSRHYVQKLADLFKSKKIKRGQYLYKENDEASELYLIQDGEFRISKKISLTIKSKLFTQNSKLKFKNHNSNTSLASLGKGELIGEEEILSDETIRSTTCQCSSDFATVMIISKENFLKYILITDEGKELIKARNLSKQGSRQAILENALKLQKINVGLIQVNVEDTPIKTKSLWTPSSIHSRNSSLLTFTHRVANLTPRPQGPDNFFERPKTPSNYLGYKYLKAEKYRIRRKIQDDVRNIHRQKPLFSGPFTSVPNLPKQEKVSIVNIQNYERKFEIDDWEFKLKQESWSSNRRLRRVGKSDHNMFRINN